MRTFFGKWAVLTGLALLIPACGDDAPVANEAAVNAPEGNFMLDSPGNDASAMESVNDATEPAHLSSENDAAPTEPPPGENAAAVLGESEGGDTGGNVTDRGAGAD